MRTHDFVKFRLDPSKFIGQDRLEQLDLPREMRVERFFANAQFRSQIIHRDTAEPVTEKVSPRRLDDLLFFFISRRRHTTYIGDWSSDVCSSDLGDRDERADRDCGNRARGG